MKLDFRPFQEGQGILAPSTFLALEKAAQLHNLADVYCAEIDPALCGGDDLCQHYEIPRHLAINCLTYEAVRGDEKSYGACLVPIGHKTDMGKTLRQHLNARRVSMAPLDYVLAETGMELGSITAIGLPQAWSVFLDSRIAALAEVMIGGGLIKSKLKLHTETLVKLTNGIFLENLAYTAS